MSENNFDRVDDIVMDFRKNCNPQYIEVLNAYWDTGVEDEEKVFEIHVEVEEEKRGIDSSTYTYPVADFGREHGLYLWDTVTDWEREKITLRFRFDD